MEVDYLTSVYKVITIPIEFVTILSLPVVDFTDRRQVAYLSYKNMGCKGFTSVKLNKPRSLSGS
jgi:hypothetical protein